MKIRFLLLVAALMSTACSGEKSIPAQYHMAKLPPDRRVEDLLRRLSIEDRIAILTATKPNDRFGIPALRMAEIPQGVFPSALGMASTWDTALAEAEGAMLAREAKVAGVNQILGPVVDIGTSANSYGDDPQLVSRLTTAFISGVQGEGLIATARYSGDSDPLRLRPLRAAVEEAGVWSVMPASGQNDFLNKWGFRGFTTGVAGDAAVALDMLDFEMPGRFFLADKLKPSLAAGEVTEDAIDEKVRRVLRVMFANGLFDREDGEAPRIDAAAHRALTRKAAVESIVLLKNEGGILPMAKAGAHPIIVVGKNRAADELRARMGSVLTAADENAIQNLAQANRGAIVILTGGMPQDMKRWGGGVAAILLATQPGEQGGEAIADVLMGLDNPSGRVPVSQIASAPPFGFGLSYGRFEYGELEVVPPRMRIGGLTEVSFILRNTGARADTEVVQVYLHELSGRGGRENQLTDFQRVELKAGEARRVRFTLNETAALRFDAKQMEFVPRPGVFEIRVGSSSQDIRSRAAFEVTE